MATTIVRGDVFTATDSRSIRMQEGRVTVRDGAIV